MFPLLADRHKECHRTPCGCRRLWIADMLICVQTTRDTTLWLQVRQRVFFSVSGLPGIHGQGALLLDSMPHGQIVTLRVILCLWLTSSMPDFCFWHLSRCCFRVFMGLVSPATVPTTLVEQAGFYCADSRARRDPLRGGSKLRALAVFRFFFFF